MKDTKRIKNMRERLYAARSELATLHSVSPQALLAKQQIDAALRDVSALLQEAEEREAERCPGFAPSGDRTWEDCTLERGHDGDCIPF